MSRIVDLTLPVVSGMAGLPTVAFYQQYPVKVQAVTVVNDEQRGVLVRVPGSISRPMRRRPAA